MFKACRAVKDFRVLCVWDREKERFNLRRQWALLLRSRQGVGSLTPIASVWDLGFGTGV